MKLDSVGEENGKLAVADDDSEQSQLIEKGYEESLALLKASSVGNGFLASAFDRKNYRAIWGRDGSICATAAFLSDDETLQETGLATLRTLADHQAPNGQLPAYIPVDDEGRISEPEYGGAGSITAIDANLWFIIACHTAEEKLGKKRFLEEDYLKIYRKVLSFLSCIDSNSCGLLEIAVAGDWTDILDRSYHVLYDEVLWYRCLKCASNLARAGGFDAIAKRYEAGAQRTKFQINDNFWWKNAEQIQDVWNRYMIKDSIETAEPYPFYQSHLQPFTNHWHHRCDAFANTLACIMGVASREQTEQIVAYIESNELNQPYPLSVLYPSIKDGDPDADNLRLCDEKPGDYHNGGIWPLAGGFWALLQHKLGNAGKARDSLENLARANRESGCLENADTWGFFEYHHRYEKEPRGTPRLAWNGAAYIMAYQAIVKDEMACFEKGGDF